MVGFGLGLGHRGFVDGWVRIRVGSQRVGCYRIALVQSSAIQCNPDTLGSPTLTQSTQTCDPSWHSLICPASHGHENDERRRQFDKTGAGSVLARPEELVVAGIWAYM